MRVRERCGLCLLVAVGIASGVSAGEKSGTTQPDAILPEIVVTATRHGTGALDLPYTLGAVGAGDIQGRKLSRTTPEAFRETQGVMIQKTSHGQGSPYIRGFTGFRTLFLVDGIRLNNSTFRDGPNQYWNTVDPFTIGRLEIVEGPASVMYGSDAIGGTVNALSPGLLETLGEDDGSGRTYYRYSTAEDSHTARAEGAAKLGEKIAVQSGGTYKDYGDLRGGKDTGRQSHTGYNEMDCDGALEYQLAPDVRLTVAHQSIELDDAWRTHKTIHGTSFHGTTIGDEKKRVLDQERHLTYAKLDAADLPGFVRDAQLTLSHHRQEEDQVRIKADGTGDIQGFDVNTLGAALQLASPSALGEWVYGVEFYRDTVDSFSRKYNADGSLKSAGLQGPVADDATYDTLGVYLQNRATVGDRFDVIFGGRYNYIEADADRFQDPVTGGQISLSENWDAVVGSARLLYRLQPDGGVNLFAGVSQGFRAPNLSDLTRLDTARTDEIETPSPDVDPEHFVTYEAGIKTAGPKHHAQAACFYTTIDDLIVRVPTGRVIDELNEVTKRNAGDGFVQGVELSGDLAFVESWVLWGNVTWMEGEVDTYPTSAPEKVREPMDRIMPLTGNLGLRFRPAERYWAEAVMTTADKADRLSTSDRADTQRIPSGGTPGYAVFSLRGGWKILENLELSAALENIADKDYRIHGSGLNEPGRNLVVAADYRF